MNNFKFLRVATICFSTLLVGLYFSQEAYALSALEEWNTESRNALPGHIKGWLILMMLNNIATLFFVRHHVAARWVFAGFFISHVLVVVMWKIGLPVLAGQVSLFHIIFWTPGFIALLKYKDEIKFPKPYAFWASFVCLFYVGSMIFDIRDAAKFIGHKL